MFCACSRIATNVFYSMFATLESRHKFLRPARGSVGIALLPVLHSPQSFTSFRGVLEHSISLLQNLMSKRAKINALWPSVHLLWMQKVPSTFGIYRENTRNPCLKPWRVTASLCWQYWSIVQFSISQLCMNNFPQAFINIFTGQLTSLLTGVYLSCFLLFQ